MGDSLGSKCFRISAGCLGILRARILEAIDQVLQCIASGLYDNIRREIGNQMIINENWVI
jgi:hypothetical protein